MTRKSIDEQLLESEAADRREREARAREARLTALRWEAQRFAYELQRDGSPAAQEAAQKAMEIVAILASTTGE